MAGLGWAGLGWAGLGCDGDPPNNLDERPGPRHIPPPPPDMSARFDDVCDCIQCAEDILSSHCL